MARTQFLINLHTSGKTNTPDGLVFGEIAVRHANDKPELIIKKDDGTFATFIDSVAIDNIVSGINKTISNVNTTLSSDIVTLSGVVDAFSAAVETKFEDYYTSEQTTAAIATAKGEAISAASAYTYSQVDAAKTTLTQTINGVNSNVTALSGVVKDFSSAVETKFSNYDTIDVVEGKIASAKTEAIASASTYTDGKIATVNGIIEGIEKNVTDLSAATVTLSEELREEIADKVSSAYIYKGTKENYTDLPGEGTEGLEVGHVYNVKNAVGAPGEPNYTPAGTNYAWTGEEWDALAGIVDLTNYTTTGVTDALSKKVDGIDSNLSTLSSTVQTFSGKVVSDYATSADTVNAINVAKGEAISAASAYTYSQVDAAKTTLTQTINGVNSNVTALSGVVETFSGAVENKFENYYTSAQTDAAIATAKGEAITSAKSYTDTEVNKAKSGLTESINGVNSNVTALSGVVETFSGAVENKFENYYTSAQTDAAIATAKGEAISAASAYTYAQVDAAKSALTKSINDLDNRIDSLETLSATTQTAIQSAIIENTEKNKITVRDAETKLIFNFDNMVIDCGFF